MNSFKYHSLLLEEINKKIKFLTNLKRTLKKEETKKFNLCFPWCDSIKGEVKVFINNNYGEIYKRNDLLLTFPYLIFTVNNEIEIKITPEEYSKIKEYLIKSINECDIFTFYIKENNISYYFKGVFIIEIDANLETEKLIKIILRFNDYK